MSDELRQLVGELRGVMDAPRLASDVMPRNCQGALVWALRWGGPPRSVAELEELLGYAWTRSTIWKTALEVCERWGDGRRSLYSLHPYLIEDLSVLPTQKEKQHGNQGIKSGLHP